MIRRYALPLLLVFLVACGASAREKALRATFTATQAAQAGFVAWDHDHLHHIAVTAPTEEAGVAQIAAYRAKSTEVEAAFVVVYRAIAAAALLDKDDRSLSDALAAYAQLKQAVEAVTGGTP